jgi:hypothetical protein
VLFTFAFRRLASSSAVGIAAPNRTTAATPMPIPMFRRMCDFFSFGCEEVDGDAGENVCDGVGNVVLAEGV